MTKPEEVFEIYLHHGSQFVVSGKALKYKDELLKIVSLARESALEEAKEKIESLRFYYGPETETPYLYGEQRMIIKILKLILALKEAKA